MVAQHGEHHACARPVSQLAVVAYVMQFDANRVSLSLSLMAVLGLTCFDHFDGIDEIDSVFGKCNGC